MSESDNSCTAWLIIILVLDVCRFSNKKDGDTVYGKQFGGNEKYKGLVQLMNKNILHLVRPLTNSICSLFLFFAVDVETVCRSGDVSKNTWCSEA